MGQARPELYFFRKLPSNLADSEFLVNSLQALETSFVLLATGRYVHALVNCVSAIEGALRAAPIDPKERDDLQTLIKKAKRSDCASRQLRTFEQSLIDEIREVRNRIVHRGFTPKDNSRCVHIYATTGISLLKICYADLHGIELDDDLRRDHAFAEHLNIAKRVCIEAAPLDIDLTYAIGSFAHLVRLFFKPTFTSDWEWEALNQDAEPTLFWELRQQAAKALERSLPHPWTFCCPVCEEADSAVCDLDFRDITEKARVTTRQIVCTHCGYAVGPDKPFITEFLLEDQLTPDLTGEILREFGIG